MMPKQTFKLVADDMDEKLYNHMKDPAAKKLGVQDTCTECGELIDRNAMDLCFVCWKNLRDVDTLEILVAEPPNWASDPDKFIDYVLCGSEDWN